MKIDVLSTGSKGNAYLISDGQSLLLLECGIAFIEIQRATGFALCSLAGCLVSHEHLDHAKSAEKLCKASVNCYMSKGTKQALRIEHHRAKTVESLKEFEAGSFTVLPFDVIHDCNEPLGFLIYSRATKEKLLFFTDTAYLKYQFEGVTHVLGEANYSLDILKYNLMSGELPAMLGPRIIKSHMSIETFIHFLEKMDRSKLQEVHLLHMSDGNGDEDRFKEKVQEMLGIRTYIW